MSSALKWVCSSEWTSFELSSNAAEHSRLIEKYSSYLFARQTHACWGWWMNKTKTIGIPPYLYFRVIVEGKLKVWFECRELVGALQHLIYLFVCLFYVIFLYWKNANICSSPNLKHKIHIPHEQHLNQRQCGDFYNWSKGNN